MDGLMLPVLIAVACLAGIWAVWPLPASQHQPFLGLTGAIGSIILIGALIATAESSGGPGKTLGLAAIFLSSIAMVGSFVLTGRAATPARKADDD